MASPGPMVIFELVFIFGGCLVFCIWQLVSLRRDRMRMEREEEEKKRRAIQR
ncbi:hypothetical protein [Afifella sp. IM 167]|uniref:hypothetical protein n=1 Tax=Afifella sp. IM 167 TaxID=2033586 RepID=UPI001CCBF018|nr:hypothetical protein [Afifella sp. IM 167]